MKKWIDIKEDTYHKISSVIQDYTYEPNNSTTWNKVKDEVVKVVDESIGSCLAEWKIVCDDNVNTEEVIEANEFHLKFCWKIEPTDEWTTVEFMLSPFGMEVR